MPRVGNDPRNGSWEREFESTPDSGRLPDCRLKFLDRDNDLVRIGGIVYERVYCADCGEPKMGVTPGVPHVFFLCDDCYYVKRCGVPPPGAVQIPEL